MAEFACCRLGLADIHVERIFLGMGAFSIFFLFPELI